MHTYNTTRHSALVVVSWSPSSSLVYLSMSCPRRMTSKECITLAPFAHWLLATAPVGQTTCRAPALRGFRFYSFLPLHIEAQGLPLLPSLLPPGCFDPLLIPVTLPTLLQVVLLLKSPQLNDFEYLMCFLPGHCQVQLLIRVLMTF